MQLFTNIFLSILYLQAVVQLNDPDGKSHKPLDLHNQKAAVFIFIATDCPISNSYAPEINRIIADEKFKSFDFYTVYCDPDLSPMTAKKHMKEYQYTCTALMDPKQVLMEKTKATVTPQAAVMDAQGNVLYLGRIDNWYEDFGKQRYKATQHELRDALDEIGAGKKVTTPTTKAVGCPI